VKIVPAIPTSAQTAKLLQPADGSLDGPADLSEVIRLLLFPLRNPRLDPTLGQKASSCLAVVAFVDRHAPRSVQRPAGDAADLRELHEHQSQKLPQVVQIGGCERDRQRNAAGGAHQMILAATAAPIRRVRAGFCPPSGAFTRPASIRTSASSSRPAMRSSVRRWTNTCCHTPALVPPVPAAGLPRRCRF
jgi:hypothetical protein